MGRLVSTSALRREVDAAVQAGKTLEEIDNEILAPCALNEDARSALWLYAWGAVGRAEVSGNGLVGGRDVVDATAAP